MGTAATEIVKDFDREVYGRVPKVTPEVNWELVKTTNETVGDVPVVVKQLVGRVDNSAFPAISVNISLTVTTPAETEGPVPLVLQFGFVFPQRPGATPPPPPPEPTWQEQVLAKGWGYAVLIPNTVRPTAVPR